MVTNVYFNNYGQTSEQELLEDLVIESIRTYGQDMYYLPRKRNSFDGIYYEDSQSSYDIAYMIEVYMKSYNGFMGQDSFMSKFGLQIRDQITFCIARRVFSDEVGAIEYLDRPQEGDLIYFPFTKGIFEIKFVEHEATFYQTGALQFFELRCEKFNYSDEKINTGIADIDNAQINNSTASDNFRILTESGNWLITQDGNDIVKEDYARDTTVSGAENDFFQDQSNTFIDFTIADPFSEGGRF